MFPVKPISVLIDDSMFIPLDKYSSKEIKDKMDNKEQHQKTVREMLTKALKDKIKRNK
jgi:hypothetical protein